MFDHINDYVARCAVLSGEETAFFNSCLQLERVPKKTFMLREGEVCHFEGYLNKGCARSYFIDEKK